MGNLTALKTSSLPRTTTSKIPYAVPRNTLSPAALISTGGYILVYSSILSFTPQISSGSIKCFDDPESTKGGKPSAF